MNENLTDYAITTKFNIPQAILDAVAEQSARSGNYSSVEKTGGFKVSGLEKTLPELKGVIDDFTFYQGRFEGGKFLKRDCTGPESEGYQNRCDLYLKISPEYTTTLSLSKTSTSAAINYFLSLKAKNLSPGDLVTRVTTKLITGQYGTYSIAVFEASDSTPQPPPIRNVTPQISQVAFTPPPPASESSIPSAWL